MNEAFKKQLLSSHEYYQAKRWEGRPWSFKFKYMIANYPEFAFASFGFMFIVPALCWYKYYTYKGSRREAIQKYRTRYTVVRPDDPNIEEIIREKELGREHFPKY